MSNTDHVVMTPEDGGTFECRHCGGKAKMPIPINVSELQPVIDGFVGEHKDCMDSKAKKEIAFAGGSDDTVFVQVSSEGLVDEQSFECLGDEAVVGEFHIGELMKVYAIYDGCWMFAVGQIDDETPVPDWPVEFLGSHGYSSGVKITVPFWTSLRQVDLPG